MTIIFDGLKLTLVDDAEYKYHSHTNGLQLVEPNNWVHCTATDENDSIYDLWYYVEDTSRELEDTDWEHPDHVEFYE